MGTEKSFTIQYFIQRKVQDNEIRHQTIWGRVALRERNVQSNQILMNILTKSHLKYNITLKCGLILHSEG